MLMIADFSTVACRRHCRSRPFRWKLVDYLAGPHLAVRILRSYITMCDVGKGAALPSFRSVARRRSGFFAYWANVGIDRRPISCFQITRLLYTSKHKFGASI